MSLAEYLELIQQASDGAVAHTMNCISIVTAYLVSMYFVGKKLTRFQLVSVTTIYTVFFYVFSLASVVGTMNRFTALRTEFSREFTDIAEIYGIYNSDPLADYVTLIIVVIMFLGWLLSILFMLNIRKSHQE